MARSNMGRMRFFLLLVAAVVGLVLLGATLLDEGEVVHLTTRNAKGAHYETSLWCVEWDAALWLRAGSERAGWLARLRAQPEVQLERAGKQHHFTATPVFDEATRQGVNAALAAKYGAPDRWIGRLFDRAHAVPIRLEPLRVEEPQTSPAAAQQTPSLP